MMAEINKIQSKKTIHIINETKSWFFEKINKIGKLLANLTKRSRDRQKLIKLEIKKGISQQIPMICTGSLGVLQKPIFK
jgi:hypothetical protein